MQAAGGIGFKNKCNVHKLKSLLSLADLKTKLSHFDGNIKKTQQKNLR